MSSVKKFLKSSTASYISKSRIKELSKLDFNEIMSLDNDYEFIWALYLKFNSGRKGDYKLIENLKIFNGLNEDYKKYIIARIHMVDDISTPLTIISGITTSVFALYNILFDAVELTEEKGVAIAFKFLVQFILVALFTWAYQKDKSYKTKCTFLLKYLT